MLVLFCSFIVSLCFVYVCLSKSHLYLKWIFFFEYMLMIGGVVTGLAKWDTVTRLVVLACLLRLVDSVLHPSKLVFPFGFLLLFFFFVCLCCFYCYYYYYYYFYKIFNKSVILFFFFWLADFFSCIFLFFLTKVAL